MSYFRITLVVLLGVSLVQALPASKPISARTKLSSKSAGLRGKTLATEEKNIDAGKEPEMAIETAEKPTTGDRKKKSAAVTLCVDIRQPPNGEMKNCDPPAPAPTPMCDEHAKHERHHIPSTLPPQPEEPIHQEMPIFIEQQPFTIMPQQPAVTCLQPQQPSIPYLSPPATPCACPCSPLQVVTTGFHSHAGRNYYRGYDNVAQMSDYSSSSGIESQPPSYIEAQQGPSLSAVASDSLYAKETEHNAEQPSTTDGYQTPAITDQAYRYVQTPVSYASAVTASGGAPSGASFRLEGPTFSGAVSAPKMNIELPHGNPTYYQSSLAMQSMYPGVSSSGYTIYPSVYASPMGYRSLYRTYEPKQAFPATSRGSPCNQQIRSQRQQNEGPRNFNAEEQTFDKSEIMMSPREMATLEELASRRTTTPGQQASRDDDKRSDEGTKENAATNSEKNRTNEDQYFASRSADVGKRETQTSINLNKDLVKSST